MSATFVIGDIHGHPESLTALLGEAGLIGADLAWSGGDSALWLLGDLTDRGPDGIGVIELVMRWQGEAAAAGGAVHSLLGNHDLLLLAVSRFGALAGGDDRDLFHETWQYNGGRESDLARLTGEQTRWLANRPAMALVKEHLLVHADSLAYARYGASVAAVNRAITTVLHGQDARSWDGLLDALSQRQAFSDPRSGTAQAEAFLERFGGQRILHGHTPIPLLTRQPADAVREPLAYADGRALNLDGGIFLGGAGFVYRLPSLGDGA